MFDVLSVPASDIWISSWPKLWRSKKFSLRSKTAKTAHKTRRKSRGSRYDCPPLILEPYASRESNTCHSTNCCSRMKNEKSALKLLVSRILLIFSSRLVFSAKFLPFYRIPILPWRNSSRKRPKTPISSNPHFIKNVLYIYIPSLSSNFQNSSNYSYFSQATLKILEIFPKFSIY